MTAHVVTIDPCDSLDFLGRLHYRWRCSCGQTGIWKPKAINARRGGVQHVAKMEK